jgi:hypothetical protein
MVHDMPAHLPSSHRPRWAAAIVLSLSAAVASADVVDIAWSPDGTFERTLVVPAGKFAELCGKLAQGAKVRWSFTADKPMAFNIHYHVGNVVTYPVRQDGASTASGDLVAPVGQDYCWMWTNKAAADARASVVLKR